MSEAIDQSLQKVARGTLFVLIGTLFGMLLAFVARVVAVRYITQSEYGLYSMAFVIAGLALALVDLGLQDGSARQIAYCRGIGNAPRIKSIILSSIWITLIASIPPTLVLIFAAGPISTGVFHDPGLATPLRILSLTIPFTALTAILAAVYRGFDKVEPKVYYRDILRSLLFLLFLAAAIFLGAGFLGLLYASLASWVVPGIAFAIYLIKRPPLPLRGEIAPVPATGKDLLVFSLPILGASMLFVVMLWVDTLMLGYFKSSQDVGLYNGATPLANFVTLVRGSLDYIYIPIAASLYAGHKLGEMKRTYQVLTKWMFAASYPIFLMLAFFPGALLNAFFGSEYMGAALALQILSGGLLLNVFLGPNSVTLIVMGKTRVLLWACLAATLANMVLNAMLIPSLGIAGAALASLIAYLVVNLFCSIRLYQISGIHPFASSYLKPLIISSAVILAVYAITTNLIIIAYWMLPLFLILFAAIYALSLILTKSIDQEDIMLISTMGKRLRINTEVVERLLRRFT